jgi:hypothetical protein
VRPSAAIRVFAWSRLFGMRACEVVPLAWDATQSLRESPRRGRTGAHVVHSLRIHHRLKHPSTAHSRYEPLIRPPPRTPARPRTPLPSSPTNRRSRSRTPAACRLAFEPSARGGPWLRAARETLATRPPWRRPGRKARPTRPLSHGRQDHVCRTARRPRRSRRLQRPYPHHLRARGPIYPARRNRQRRDPARPPVSCRQPLRSRSLPPLGPPPIHPVPEPALPTPQPNRPPAPHRRPTYNVTQPPRHRLRKLGLRHQRHKPVRRRASAARAQFWPAQAGPACPSCP